MGAQRHTFIALTMRKLIFIVYLPLSDMGDDVARECIWALGEFGAASAPAPYAFEALVERMPTVSSPATRSVSSCCQAIRTEYHSRI